MASLKEIKGRIASVRRTLKITSAMKMVAASKLHRTQQAVEGMRPYERALQEMLTRLQATTAATSVVQTQVGEEVPDRIKEKEEVAMAHPVVALMLFTSNSSLCGSFNANAIRHFYTELDALHAAGIDNTDIRICTIGKKGADAVRRSGLTSWMDYSVLAEHPTGQGVSELADKLLHAYNNGEIGSLRLIYNHYVSNASQPTVVEELSFPSSLTIHVSHAGGRCGEFIVEPSCEELLSALQPRVFRQKLFSTLLDAQAAEHAARVVAMQIASDNADKLLEELTLEYNKSRQQKITFEILDLVGGQQR